MKRTWNTLSQQSNGLYAVADFERAAYRLVTEQVLYASDTRSRSAYHLVEAYLEDFAAAGCASVEVWLTKLEDYLKTHSLDDARESVAAFAPR